MTPSSVLRMPAQQATTESETSREISAKATHEPGLDDLLYATAHENQKPFKALADDIGMPVSRLYAAINPHEPQPFPVRKLVPLMRAARDFSVLRWMAHACGFLLIEAPEIHTPADVVTSIGHIAHETGDVLRTLGAVLADGRVCAQDAREARKEVGELLNRAHALDQALARIEGR